MKILDFFPYPKPRPSQRKVLEEVEAQWDKYDVFVVRVPVAGGKSAIATTIQDWQLAQENSAAITVPNNMLRDQLIEEFDWLCTLKAREDYWLPRFKCTVKDYMQRYKLAYGPKGCQYNEDRKIVRRKLSPIVMNYMGYQAHKLFREVLIVDEAHQMLSLLQDMHSTTLWKHKVKYPDREQTSDELLRWIGSTPEPTRGMVQLQRCLTGLDEICSVQYTEDLYRGNLKECIKLRPINVAAEAPIFWPKKTGKIILMSATIDPTDVASMGLATRRVCYLDAPSEIPQPQRRIVVKPAGSMAMRQMSSTLPALVTSIEELLAAHKDVKGMIHATYETAKVLRDHLDDPRLMFHTRSSKSERFNEFLASPPEEARVFVGSGMAEGIDLKEDCGRFQIITKVPYPSLADPANRYLMKHYPEVYSWKTTKELLQASGRICRTPTDWGVTYILDSEVDRWYQRAKDFGQIPDWFAPEHSV